MPSYLVILSLAVCCLATFGEAIKCDNNLLKEMKEKFWKNGKSTPKNLLRISEELSPELVMKTTYYPEEDNIGCIYSTAEGSVIKLYVQHINSTGVSTTPTTVINATEGDGYIFQQATGVYRYHLYANKEGVTAFYKCGATGESGDPEGLIKVSARWYDEKALRQSIKDLASLGIKVNDKVYGVSCAPK